jgi:signal transduction histidine kinase
LVAIPVVLAAVLFGKRGAAIGSITGIVAFGGVYVVAGVDTFEVLTRGTNPINIIVLVLLALLVGYVRRFQSNDLSYAESQLIEMSRLRDRDQEIDARRVELNQVAMEFNSLAHKSAEVNNVSRCVVTHVSRALRPDYLAIAVTDLEARKITIEQSIGMRLLGFTTGDVRAVSEALNDSISSGELTVLNEDDFVGKSAQSHFAVTAVEAGVRSAIVANYRNDAGELIAQLWIGSTKPNFYTDVEADFVEQISDHLKSAVINARNSESLKELQRYLVGQNELFAQMQDGIENTEGHLRLSHQQVTELSDSKTQFMAEVAHEVKSPLAVMIGYADLLRYDVENLDDDQREFATSIEKAARQLTVLIDDLSDITNIESGHFTTAKEPHDVVKVVAAVVSGLKISNTEMNERLSYSGSDVMFDVEGDPARLSQVFTNLISNAVKYSSDDMPIEVAVKQVDGTVRISVSDRGLGISDEDMSRLFTPYFRSKNPEATERPGTGLGLFLSKSIIEEHGGTLTVSSRMGLGSTFTVELPEFITSFVVDAA